MKRSISRKRTLKCDLEMSSIGLRADLPLDTGWVKRLALLFDVIEFPVPEAPLYLAGFAQHIPGSEDRIGQALAEYQWLRLANIVKFTYLNKHLEFTVFLGCC